MKPMPQVSGFRIASPLVSGILWSIIWLAVGTLLVSVVLYTTSVAEQNLVSWIFGVHGYSSFCGGFVSARKSGHRGWSIGLATGLLYALIVLLASFLANDMGWSARIPLLLAATAAAGAIGGIMGVNTGSGGGPKGRK